ncbi:MAG: DUF4830 domain-containing protein [Clostridiales bacterium]|nr:DUF4830 domain-containing protein [Clostridiales bacterium]
MKILTLKLKPKMIFGIILAVTGVVVIALTFVSNRVEESKSVSASISASTNEERVDYLSGFGWEVEEEFETKELTIPQRWNDVYIDYNEVQENQGFDLTDYKGRNVTLYTYTITNYKDINEGIVADMLVCDGILIGGDICNTSADDGFLVGFSGE